MLLRLPCHGVDLDELELDKLSAVGVVELAAYAESRGIGIELKTANLSMRSHVRVQQTTAVPDPEPSSSIAPASIEVCSADTVGILRLEHPGRSAPLARAGQIVKIGDPVAILQVGIRYSVVRAPSNGTIQRCLVAPGTLVGFGEPLIELLPEVSA
ncbi:hypothetical protein [Cupriavidus sp. IK-TO18]|uniref:hypothetical protein n=1 Tax=Cupriavidus sp. IK-TO18 TaxID=2782182 RepID=UPI00189A3A4B|nr:hypothetical protein [Cupriavidus sp. IK-TO18]MBF6989135.1 hypothetical protein [Cupriavidus sp. IK-TO18]